MAKAGGATAVRETERKHEAADAVELPDPARSKVQSCRDRSRSVPNETSPWRGNTCANRRTQLGSYNTDQ